MKRFLCACTAISLLWSSSNEAIGVTYRFTNVADTTTAAPTGSFSDFGDPAISGNVVAFRAHYMNSAPSEGGNGIFAGSGGSLTTIAKRGDLGPLGTLLGFSDPSISGSKVAFRGTFPATPDPVPIFLEGVFTGDGGPLSLIAMQGVDPSVGLIGAIGAPAIDGDTVVFHSGNDNIQSGIFAGGDGPLTSIAKTGDTAPSGAFGVSAANFGMPSTSDGTTSFRGSYPGGVAIFTGSGGPLSVVVETGDAASSGVFTDVANPTIGGTNIAFKGTYTSGGNGIFVTSGGLLTTIVATGDSVPAGTLTNPDIPSIGGSSVAFIASLNGIGPGIFIGDGGPVTTVIKISDPLFGSSVLDLSFSRFGLDPDGTGGLAFQYLLLDGRVGIAMATPIPEPGTLALCVVALLWFLPRRGVTRDEI
jgi:hypothetical protein